MAFNKLCYDRTYNLGDALYPWHVRLRINLRSTPLLQSGAETNDANLAANSLADVEFESVGDFNIEIDANNAPRVNKIANVSWSMKDTPAYDFRTNVLIPAVEQAAMGARLYVRFDCDYGMVNKGAWSNIGFNEYDSVTNGGVRYVCVLAHTTGHAPPNATYWLAVTPAANLMMRDFTGMIDPTQLATNFVMADFPNSLADERMKFTAMDAMMFAFEESPAFDNMLEVANIGPSADGGGPPVSMYETMTDWKRPLFYQTFENYPWNADSFDKDWWNQGGGAITDWNFARLGNLLKSFQNFYRWSLDGVYGTTMSLTSALTGDHFTLRYGLGAHHGHVGYPTNELFTKIMLNEHISIENHSQVPLGGYTYPYEGFNLDGASVSSGNFANIGESFSALLESFLIQANLFVNYDSSGNESVHMTVTSPLSPTIRSLVYGDPELVSLKGTLQHTPSYTPCARASASIKRPPGIEHQYFTDTPGGPTDPSFREPDYAPFDDTPYDLFNPTYSQAILKGSATINLQLLFGTFWDDWPDNQLSFLFDEINFPTEIAAADFDMALQDTGGYPANNPVTITQTWGGGMLNLGVPTTINAQTYQHAMALGAFSLWCGGIFGGVQRGMEKVVERTRIIPAMIGGLPDAILSAFKARGYDAQPYRYLTTGVSWNTWKIKGAEARSVKLTGVRTIGY